MALSRVPTNPFTTKRLGCLQASGAAVVVALGTMLLFCFPGVSAWDDGSWVKINGPGWLRLGCRYKTGWYESNSNRKSVFNWWQHKDTGSHKVNQYACTILNTGNRDAWEVRLSCKSFHPDKKWHINNDCSIPDNVPAYGQTEFVYQTTGGPARFHIKSYYVKKQDGGDPHYPKPTPSPNPSPRPNPSPNPTPSPPVTNGGLVIECRVTRTYRGENTPLYYEHSCSLTNNDQFPVTNITLDCQNWNPIVKWGPITLTCLIAGVVAPNGGVVYWGWQDLGERSSFSVKDYDPVIDVALITATIGCKSSRNWTVAGLVYKELQCSLQNPLKDWYLSDIILDCPNFSATVKWGYFRQLSPPSAGKCAITRDVAPLTYVFWGYQTTGTPTTFSVSDATIYQT